MKYDCPVCKTNNETPDGVSLPIINGTSQFNYDICLTCGFPVKIEIVKERLKISPALKFDDTKRLVSFR